MHLHHVHQVAFGQLGFALLKNSAISSALRSHLRSASSPPAGFHREDVHVFIPPQKKCDFHAEKHPTSILL
jgi:hypothetical protein